MKQTKYLQTIIGILLAAAIILFFVTIFKNLAYPLLWNDEAETAMFGQRILAYGYPKVHDGKNILNLLELPNKNLAVDARTDAWLCLPWGQYYWAAAGVFLATKVENLYAKTFFIRFPFAFIGFLGVLLMAFVVSRIFGKDKKLSAVSFLFLFVIGELISIPLALHIREVRWYSLDIFFTSCIFYLYLSYAIFEKMRPIFYVTLMAIFLIVIFNCFMPGYFILLISIGFFELIKFLNHPRLKNACITMVPFFLTAPVIILLMSFYGSLNLSHEFVKFFSINDKIYQGHIRTAISFFWNCELLLLAVIMKSMALGAYVYSRIIGRRIVIEKNERFIKVSQGLAVSIFLSIFFAAQIFVISRTPYLVVYERYFIILQPVLVLMILLDLFIFVELANRLHNGFLVKVILPVALIAGIFFKSDIKTWFIKAHIYELTHQYRGPLDFVIPYINNTYKNPERLVVATNYEEVSYMYYLGSKVTIGYVGNNLEKDLEVIPDIIVYRKRWAYTNYAFDRLIKMAAYKKISFPVEDYLVNNIAETQFHLFKTPVSKDQSSCLDIYVKE